MARGPAVRVPLPDLGGEAGAALEKGQGPLVLDGWLDELSLRVPQNKVDNRHPTITATNVAASSAETIPTRGKPLLNAGLMTGVQPGALGVSTG